MTLIANDESLGTVRTKLNADLIKGARAFSNVASLQADTSLTYTAGEAGTVEVGTVIWCGPFVYDVVASDAEVYQLETAGGVRLTLRPDYVHPKAFGAKADNSTDDGAALNAFFAYIATADRGLFDFSGTYRSSVGLILHTIQNKTIHCNAQVTFTTGVARMVDINACVYMTLTGLLYLIGPGGVDISTNTAFHGYYITSSTRLHICKTRIANGLGHAVNWHNSGTSNFVTFDAMQVNSFGATNRTGRVHLIDVATFTNGGGANSRTTQYTELALAAPHTIPDDSGVRSPAFVIINGEPYQITDYIDASTIRVFPWVPTADRTAGEYGLIYGGGASSTGLSSKTVFTNFNATSCGVGFRLSGTRPGTAHAMSGQSCGITLMLGNSANSYFQGSAISQFYTENAAVANILYAAQREAYIKGTHIFGATGTTGAWQNDDLHLFKTLTPKANAAGFVLPVLVRWPLRLDNGPSPLNSIPVVVDCSAGDGNIMLVGNYSGPNSDELPMQFGVRYAIKISETTAFDGDASKTFRLGTTAGDDTFLAPVTADGTAVAYAEVSGTVYAGQNIILSWTNNGAATTGQLTVEVKAVG